MTGHGRVRIGRVARALALVVGLVAAAAVAGPPVERASAAPATPAQGADRGDDAAVLDLVGCLSGTSRLAVVLLIDESQSLQLLDPEDRRVDAALTALDSLAVLAGGAAGAPVEIDVTLAAFADEFRTILDWTAVTDDTLDDLRAALRSFDDLDQGIDTDFTLALSGARTALGEQVAARTEEGGEAPCRAVLLFTDGGRFALSPRPDAAPEDPGATKPYAPGLLLEDDEAVDEAIELGIDALCSEGGLADGLRSDDVTLLTISLTFEGDETGFLEAMSTGESTDGTERCGSPVDTPPGRYIAADDADTLVAAFDEIGVGLAGGAAVPGDPTVPVCEDGDCEDGARTAETDASTRRLRALVLAPEPGITVEISGPAGDERIDAAGTLEIGAVPVTVTEVTERGYAVDLLRPEDPADLEDWAGTWTVRAVDPSGDQVGSDAVVALYVFSDIRVELTDVVAPVRGGVTEIEAALTAPPGVDLDVLVEESTVTVRLEDPVAGTSSTIELEGPPSGPFTGTIETPASYRSSSYAASVEVRARTTSGSEVVARSQVRPLVVLRPSGHIQVAPGTLDLPPITGSGTSSADLVVVGGDEDGCIWFGDDAVTGPPEGGAMVVTYDGREAVDEAGCIDVAAGATLVVPVEISPENRATGAVRGALEIFERTDGTEVTATDLPVSLDLAVGVDEVRRLVLAVALLLGGLALPLALLTLLGAASARFQDLEVVRGAVIRVRVQGRDVFRVEKGRSRPFSLRPGDFTSLRDAGDVKRFTFGGVEFRARPSRNPFAGTVATAAPEGGAERLKGRAGAKVELDPALAGSWIFLLDPDRTRTAGRDAAEGDLLAFVAEGDAEIQLSRLNPELGVRLPETAGELAGLVRSQKRRRRRRRRPDEAERERDADATGADDATADEGTGEVPGAGDPPPDGSRD